MADINFEISGMDDLIHAFDEVQKKYPATTEKALKKEARLTKKNIEDNVRRRAAGHGSKPGTLENSFKLGKVMKSGSRTTIAIVSTAPHYHLVEEGHDLYSHSQKNKRGKGKIGTDKLIGHVTGKKFVGEYMAKRSEYSELIGMELLNEILRELE